MGVLALFGCLRAQAQNESQGKIKLTTTLTKGETLELYIRSEGDISIEGASGKVGNNTWSSLTIETATITIHGDINYLSCHGNMITALDFSECPTLEELSCYENAINSAAMDALIASLPNRNGKENGIFRVFYGTSDKEKNVCSTDHVNKAKEKGWTALETTTGSEWIEYKGSNPINSITPTTPTHSSIVLFPATQELLIKNVESMPFYLFDTNGILILRGETNSSGETLVSLPNPGVYVLKVNSFSHKVLL